MERNPLRTVFINYRVADTHQTADRLAESLRNAFGDSSVFLDKKGLAGGMDWPDELRRQAELCTAMLVLIGRDWENIKFESGARKGFPRLSDPGDWVRMEIDSALKLQKLVIPILVDNGRIPEKDWLANVGLEGLHSKQWMTVSTDTYPVDSQRLIRKLTPLISAHATPLATKGADLEALRQNAIAVTQRVVSAERTAYPKYMRDVYAARADAEQRFRAFLDGRSFVYVVIGRSGMGKTCLLYNLAESLVHPESTSDRIPLLVDLKHVDFSKDSLEQFLSHQLGYDSIDGPATVLAHHNATLVIFVDAINELAGKDNLTDFNRQLGQLRSTIDRNGYRIRFCISCRTLSWQYFESQPWAEHRVRVELNGYDRNDLGRIIKLYFDRFKIEGTLKGEAREECADPLILRFLCLAYTRDPERNVIGEVTSLRRKDIFEKYAAAMREEIGRAIGSQEALTERTTRYITHIANKMLTLRRAYVTREEVKEVADEIDHPDKQFEPRQLDSNSGSYFSKLVDLIFESERDGYGFIFEAYFEFSLGRHIAEVRWPGFTGNDRVRKIGDDLTWLMRNHAQLTAESNFPNLFDALHYAVLGTECEWSDVSVDSVQHPHVDGGYESPDIFLELLQRLLQSREPGIRALEPALSSVPTLPEVQLERPSLQFDWIQQACSIIRDSKLLRSRPDSNSNEAAVWQRTFGRVLGLLDDLTLVTDFVISWDLQDTLEDLARTDFKRTLAEVENWFTSPSTLKKMFAAQTLARLGSDEQLNKTSKNEVVRVLLDLLNSRDFRANFWLTRPITFAVGELAMRPEFRREWTGSMKDRLNQLVRELAELPGQSRDVCHIRGVALPLLAILSEGRSERLLSLTPLIQTGSRWALWNLAFEFQKWPDLWTDDPRGWLWLWKVLADLATTGDPHLRYAVQSTSDSLQQRAKKWDKEFDAVIGTVDQNLRVTGSQLAAARMPVWQKGADTGPSDWRGLDRIGIVYSPAYLEPANDNHLECRERVQAIIDTLEATAAGKFTWVTPRHATEKDLTRAHSKRSDRHRNGFPWDGYVETVREESRSSRIHTGPRERRSESFEIATLSAGGVLEAVDYVRKGDARAAFALTRPPGHLANNSICIFNNIAVGALYANEWYRRILIVDCDAHHGQHTQRVFYSNPNVLYFSMHIDNDYTRESGTVDRIGAGEGSGYNFNIPYPAGMDDRGYKYIIDTLLFPVAREFAPDMIFVSAGFDGHFDDYLTPDCVLTDEAYIYLAERLRDLAVERNIRIVGALEGGYGLEGQANSLVGMLGVWGNWDGASDGRMKRTPVPADLPDRYQEGAFEEVKRTVRKRIELMRKAKEKSGEQYPLFADRAWWEGCLRAG